MDFHDLYILWVAPQDMRIGVGYRKVDRPDFGLFFTGIMCFVL